MIDTGFQFFSFTFQEVAPSKSDILDFIRSSDSDEHHPVNIIIENLLQKLSDHNKITGGYIIKPVSSLDVKSGKLLIDGNILETGSQIAAYLKGASHAALFICTAGDVFTKLSKDFNSKGDYLEAYIVDAIGSLTVENAMDRIQEKLSQSLSGQGLSISNRYSPGYCNWTLVGQQDLFKLIGGNPVGVSLSESSLMDPIKSVSGIIGIGEGVKKRDYGCNICNNKTCIYRKILNK